MWARLALALHASKFDAPFDLCELNPAKLQIPHKIPTCLHDSVRFQHFGCDFHIDEDLTGAESRLFECNKVRCCFLFFAIFDAITVY
jgi:hypothetical protein